MEISNNKLLRFTTAGSVDDGKSTLIGRLLYDSKSIFEDQIEQVEKTSKRKGHEGVDLALFTDGLRDEREQGITIDVAYRYFTTPNRKFIIADTPGHIQYTRNMVTGASTANAAIVLVDARHGIVEQTKRHIFIAHLLGIPHILICINKMDLVDYSEDRFYEVAAGIKQFITAIGIGSGQFIPISALEGDNVVNKTKSMPWYAGDPLLTVLEGIEPYTEGHDLGFRFPVQTALRPQSSEFPDFRGYAGRVEGSEIHVGDEVMVLPGGQLSTISAIDKMGTAVSTAGIGESVVVCIADDIDVARGNMLVSSHKAPQVGNAVRAIFCWMDEQPMRSNTKYIVRQCSDEALGIIKSIGYKLDINTLEKQEGAQPVTMNDIFEAEIRFNKPVFTDPYKRNRVTGSFVLIDPGTNRTVAAAMVQ